MSSDDEVPHTARASTRALRDAGIASFICEADQTQLDPSDCDSLMEHEQRGPDEASAGAHSASKVLGIFNDVRFHPVLNLAFFGPPYVLDVFTP